MTLIMGLFIGAVPAAAAVIGDIVRVGYPTTTGHAIRAGSWAPVVVDLTLAQQSRFTGILRLQQADRDGDIFADRASVNLIAEGGSQQRYTLYTVPNPSGFRESGVFVELLATEDGDEATAELERMISGGAPVPKLLPPVPPMVIPDDDLLILSVSNDVLGKVRYLLDAEEGAKLAREIHIAHVSPDALPNQWIGLEMIDAIVWDDADPTAITPTQQRALVEWIRQGGELMVAAARTSDTLAQSDLLGPLLPVRVESVRSTADLVSTKKVLLMQRDDHPALKRPIAVAMCSPVDDPSVRVILHEDGIDAPIVASRQIGRGRLIFVAAPLKDLLAEISEARPAVMFFKNTLELRRGSPMESSGGYNRTLFPYMESVTAFTERSGAFLAAAMLFAVVYVLVSTLGAWRLLGTRNLLKHSWTALAVSAVAASALSIAGVQYARGIGRSLHQLSVVDIQGGTSAAQASAYFGLTTSVHSLEDVWLPQDPVLQPAPAASPCFLRPLPAPLSVSGVSGGFTDPARYELHPSTATISRVPVRATLKQFEGRWTGAIAGTVTASLATREQLVQNASGEMVRDLTLTDASWLQNNLDVDLVNCFLFVTGEDVFERVNIDTSPRASASGRAMAIPLGKVAAGNRLSLVDRLYFNQLGRPLTVEERSNWSLRNAQRSWGSNFAMLSRANMGMDDEVINYDLSSVQNALLLVTVLSDLDPTMFQNHFGGSMAFSAERCRQLDLSDLLTRRTAIFVGFSNQPGPARLYARTGNRDYRPIDPDPAHTVTMYRVLLEVNAQ